jgi:hypothetical protein
LSLDERRAIAHKTAVRGKILIAALLLSAASAATAADEAPICAARPGKSTPPCTVPAGHWQIETGLVDWSRQSSAGERDTSLVLGETTVKYGVTDTSDIEVDVTPWQRATSRVGNVRDSVSGIGDLVIAYKQQLTRGDGPVQMALLPSVKAPTANHRLGNGKWEAALLAPVSIAIGGSPFSLGLTPEIDWAADGDGHGHHAAMVQVASLGWQANDKLSLSAELWGQWDWDPDGTTRQRSADASVAYLVNRNLQLDAGANFGLNRNTPDVELYAGISKRF